MGSIPESTYSVRQEAQKVFDQGILNNPLLPHLPDQIHQAGRLVTFTSSASDAPSIPVNWRFAESTAALKAFEASLLNVLRARKYNVPLSPVTINTDHASVFIMTPLLDRIVQKDGSVDGSVDEMKFAPAFDASVGERFGIKNTDVHNIFGTLHNSLVTNIYRTKDDRFYHTHGSLQPAPVLKALGMASSGEDQPGDDFESVLEQFKRAVEQFDAGDLDSRLNDQYRQAGTVCWSTEEYAASEHGKANEHVGLYELHKSISDDGENPPPTWWSDNQSLPSSPQRPLAGLKVLDFTRIIAAPTITRSLAEMGASVMRVTSPHLPDLHNMHLDLNWGKWNCSLDLKDPANLAKLHDLVAEADVVVDGYRPGVLEKYGLSRKELFRIAAQRGRGIVHVRENCYGWHGPWAGRSGWQQISDACCGVSLSYGHALGVNEAVTPLFPNSDYSTGIAGSCGVLHALLRRSIEGASYGVDVALNYYSRWLVRSVGIYPDAVWKELWERSGSPKFRHWQGMWSTIPIVLKDLWEKGFFQSEFFEQRESRVLGATIRRVKPVARFGDGEKDDVQLGFNVGTRGNGTDLPHWPEDLSTEWIH